MPRRRHTIAAVLQKTARTLIEAPGLRLQGTSNLDAKKFLSLWGWRERWRTLPLATGMTEDIDTHHLQDRLLKVQERLGVVPHIYGMGEETSGVSMQLWLHAKTAYLDNPLPPLFKERLFVHVSRFCEMRYCIVRHVGLLIGKGYPAGDCTAEPESIEQAIALLTRPVPNAAALEAVFARLESFSAPADIPLPRTRFEEDLFDALTVVFVVPSRSTQARAAVRHAVGPAAFERIAALLAYIRTEHYWTETHPDLTYETDMILLMAQRQDLARKLLDSSDSDWAHAGDALREALTGQLQVLNTELQHRTRNLLSVIQVVFERTLAKHTAMEPFTEVFAGRLDAISRVQTYLSRLVQGDKVTFDGLLRSELAAHAISPRQITLDGPDGVRLRSTTLQTFALAVHELAVNAVKHGALSCPSAHLTVRWHVERLEGQPPLLHVEWEETGVTVQASDPDAKDGYGRELIERALPYQMKAKTRYDMTADGVRCAISIPVLA